jgi:DNA invertase Pin-like site-specific DNA recombinase
MKRAALYCRVSTVDQHPETQLHELRQFASQRGLQVVKEFIDKGISGTKARRPGLDQMLEDARRRRFDTLLVWSCDRLARSTRHFLQVLDELDSAGVEFISQRECFDTTGPLGRAFLAISAVLAEMERSLLIERVKSGMRRAKLDGKRIGREPMQVDREQVIRDRSRMSLSQVAKKHGISRASVCRLVKQSEISPVMVPCAEQQLSATAE